MTTQALYGIRQIIAPSQWSPEAVEITATLPSGRTAKVEAYGPGEVCYGGESPAAVNWSALGSTSPEDAAAYAGLLAFAAGLAPTLKRPTGEGR